MDLFVKETFKLAFIEMMFLNYLIMKQLLQLISTKPVSVLVLVMEGFCSMTRTMCLRE